MTQPARQTYVAFGDPERFQASFAAALRSVEPPQNPAGLTGEAARRFRVYRNNVHAGLAATLADAYPVVARLVGADFFAALARIFVPMHLPQSRSLAHYGAEFPEFLARFPPVATIPYLPDVARLERARLEALHAVDAPPLDPAGLTGLGDALVQARLLRHPAVRRVRSAYPIAAIWEANRPGIADTRVELVMADELVLVTRPVSGLEHLRLTGAEALFADRLLDGAMAGDAADDAVRTDPRFDVTDAFRRLLATGVFTGLAD